VWENQFFQHHDLCEGKYFIVPLVLGSTCVQLSLAIASVLATGAVPEVVPALTIKRHTNAAESPMPLAARSTHSISSPSAWVTAEAVMPQG
jgi:hypothetical protein